MARKRIDLRIVTPLRLFLHEQVDEVVLPGSEGEFGVLPDHTPMLALLKPGEGHYREGSIETWFAISGGFAEVLPDRVTVLADAAEFPQEIDVDRARRARDAAQAALLASKGPDDVEVNRVRLDRALIRLQVVGKLPK